MGGQGSLQGADSLLVSQKVNCVQFNEEATIIVSGKEVVSGGPASTRAPP